jgi:hypothetical protein
MQADVFQALQQWYLAECNGDWEHSYGVHIETLDNPGWMLKVDLRDTSLAERSFQTAIREHEQRAGRSCFTSWFPSFSLGCRLQSQPHHELSRSERNV